MEEVGNRIKLLINGKKISNSQMADHIDLPRPVLSHILSGRNKASLAVVQKIISGYPDVNPKWLLLGNGEMLKTEHSPIQDIEIKKDKTLKTEKSVAEIKPKTELDSIVHYYKDGSFKVFLPK